MEFEIINFEAAAKRYYPASVELGILDDGNYVKHTAIEIPLGQSRYGGPIIDLPPDLNHPEDLRFVCQLDLQAIGKYDLRNRLPKSGQLIVFCDIMTEQGKVIYTDVENESLKRIIVEHDEDFWDGVLIEKLTSSTESWEERYRFPEDDWEAENLKHLFNAEGKLWDDFAGSKRSKMFGSLTHCQLGEAAIKKTLEEDKIVLVQFGENGFNDEGVFSVLITKQDLSDLNFGNCEFYWGQS